MTSVMPLGEVLEAVDKLSLEEQETLREGMVREFCGQG